MKKILSIVLAVCMMFSLCAVPAMAEESAPISQVQTKDIITITVNGNWVDCSTYGQLPVIVEGRTLVPLRAVFEALGATVAWDDATKTVTSVKGDITVALTVGTNQITVNDEAKTIDVPAQIMNDRTMVPVRAVAEAFGCDVQWDNNTRTVVITSTVVEAPVTEETPEAVVKKAYDAMLALDFETSMSCYKNPDAELGEFAGAGSVSDIVNMAAGGEELSETQVKLVEKFTKDIMGLISYEIKGSVINGNTAEVTVATTTPNFESIDLEAYLTEEAITVVYMQVFTDMGYTVDDLYSMTEEDTAKMEEALTEAIFDYIVEVFYQAAEEAAPMITEDVEKLEKVDGKWLIVE